MRPYSVDQSGGAMTFRIGLDGGEEYGDQEVRISKSRDNNHGTRDIWDGTVFVIVTNGRWNLDLVGRRVQIRERKTYFFSPSRRVSKNRFRPTAAGRFWAAALSPEDDI
jgi:hypothetical protein